jgi:hypothetical protein
VGCVRLIMVGFPGIKFQHQIHVDWTALSTLYPLHRSVDLESQVIKDLYAGFPERMGEKLASRRKVMNDIPAEEQLSIETDAEVDYLKKSGLDEPTIQKRLPVSKDPVTFGVKKIDGVLRATQLG